ncbi:MAG: phenylalanine 4-monooxygenase [Planctomycetota bacterium]|nr:MAG: phenylalanine 4-monooxygenase [Planctomycetota bacterium]REJ86953.1 MAG: phenylalanine 4-monooxygenase [Planctomycetota bacterium]REK24920.1 MAG: phenylalanine 4-monooxygenase [Planctomycetota bacterium]REK48509.1 MAG: phenylalanine 4-monooxygenase [Planctomycetota bacterium]
MTVQGLTTTEAPFIENAQRNGELFIQQPYELYSDENQDTWQRLYRLIHPKWERYAAAEFLAGVEKLRLGPDAIPRLEDINRFLDPLSGFSARAVSGYVPAYIFFDCLRQRAFPTTITIRSGKRLEYLPEPDIFHDVAGHVPMHTDRKFADILVRFGEVARRAAARSREMEAVDGSDDKQDRLNAVRNTIKAMARFFWFTVEFGIMRQGRDIKVYGSGLLSSAGEIEYSIESADVQRYPLQLEWVINQYFEIDHYQPLLFVADSYEHVFDLVEQLETWMDAGRLDNVAPGEPHINEEDLKSFLAAGIEAKQQPVPQPT